MNMEPPKPEEPIQKVKSPPAPPPVPAPTPALPAPSNPVLASPSTPVQRPIDHHPNVPEEPLVPQRGFFQSLKE